MNQVLALVKWLAGMTFIPAVSACGGIPFSYVDQPAAIWGVSQAPTTLSRSAVIEILLGNGRKVAIDVELKLLALLVA